MSARLGRCFVNSFPDFAPGQGEIANARWMEAAKSSAADVHTHMPPLPEHCDGGLYVGNAGVAYMFYHLSKNTQLVSEKSHFLQKAQEYLKISLAYSDSRMSRDPLTSFILGKAGVYALACAIYAETGDGKTSDAFADKFVKIAAQCKTKGDFLGCGSDELFVGRAGYLCGELFLRKTLGRQVSGDGDINGVCAAIVSSGRQYSQTHRSPCPLMYAYYGTEYLGAAHGLSSILQMLLCFPGYLKSDSSAEHDVRQCVEFMLSLEQPNGNYPPAMDDVKRPTAESEQLVHWCHGAPGIVYLFGRAYLHWKDSRYLDACVRCADLTWRCGLLRKGPGICHGVAGSGYVFLLLYRLTNEQKYLYRAEKFAEFLYTPEFKSGSRRPDTPFSLYEGWAGAACFLADLLEPNKAAFPLFDIF